MNKKLYWKNRQAFLLTNFVYACPYPFSHDMRQYSFKYCADFNSLGIHFSNRHGKYLLETQAANAGAADDGGSIIGTLSDL